LRNFGEVVQKLTLAFGDGIPMESGEIADKGDTIMADGKGKESGDVPLVTLVEPFKQQPARRLVFSQIVLNHLGATHCSSLKTKTRKNQYNTSKHFLKYQFGDLI
jgi:hypothetical protein